MLTRIKREDCPRELTVEENVLHGRRPGLGYTIWRSWGRPTCIVHLHNIKHFPWVANASVVCGFPEKQWIPFMDADGPGWASRESIIGSGIIPPAVSEAQREPFSPVQRASGDHLFLTQTPGEVASDPVYTDMAELERKISEIVWRMDSLAEQIREATQHIREMIRGPLSSRHVEDVRYALECLRSDPTLGKASRPDTAAATLDRILKEVSG